VAAHLNTLATAYAAAGQLTDAIETAQTAIELARSAGQLALAREIDSQLQSYRNQRASRHPAVTSVPSPP
jgi:hypothetical protein